MHCAAMKTRTYHISNLGQYGAAIDTDASGYVTAHDSSRYKAATIEQLNEYRNSRIACVRAAAETEIAERQIRNRNAN